MAVLLVLGLASSAVPVLPPLPLGATASAPRQNSGSADGLEPRSKSANTATALQAPAHDQARPPGAVPDTAERPPAGPQPDVTAQRHEKPAVVQKPDKPSIDEKAKERPQDRTENTETFDNPDGSRTLRVHSGQSNVRRPDGSWAPIDLALGERDDRWQPKNSPHATSFGRTSRDAELATVAFEKGGISYRLDDAADSRGTADQHTVTYPAVFPGVDLKLTATERGVKEDLVLASAEARSSFGFTVRARDLTPRLVNGTIELVDGDKVIASIARGFALDAKQQRVDTNYELAKNADGTWALKVVLDPKWLRDPARSFPVVIDPTINSFAADDSTYVTPSGNGSGAIDLRTGYVDGQLSRSYLHFDRNALNGVRNQFVLGAALVVEAAYSTTCAARSVSVYEVTQPWDAGGMRWPGAPVGKSLSTKAFVHGGPSCPGAAWEKLPLDYDTMTRWTHGQALQHGLALRASDETDRNGMRFGSVNSPNKPYLEISYVPEGVSFEVTDVTLPSASRAGNMKVKVTNFGSTTWTSGGGWKFGYIINQGSTRIRTACCWAQNVAPGATALFDVPIDPINPGDYSVFLTMFNPQNNDFFVAYGVPYGRFEITVRNTPPTSNLQQPGGGAIVPTTTPTLYAEGVDDDRYPGKGLTYKFIVCTNADLNQGCQESGWGGQSWAPSGLFWNRTYFWGVKVYDTVDATPFWVSAKDNARLMFTPRTQQPEITSHLAGSPSTTIGPGLDPQIGNYSAVVADADVDTVGPDLTVGRTYNSLDPRRDTAFGVGWSSRVDMRLTKDQDGSENVVITYPTGRQGRFGRNPDGSFAPPSGQNAELVLNTATGQYVLRDASASRWTFDILGRLVTITDPAGLTETLTYDTDDHVTTITNDTSGRSLALTWQGNHVSSVSAAAPETGGQPLTWTYTYDGDKLTQSCAPGQACTTLKYRAGSHYRSSVLDDSPYGYWRLGETSGDTFASVAARRPGTDAGQRHGVVLGGDGALAGSSDKSGTFDGVSSYVTLPDNITNQTMSLAAELWFKTTAEGTLLSYADQSFPTAAGTSTPILYVGTDGLLYGGFARQNASGPRQIVTTRKVDDGQWHHVVLSAAINTQTLYLDGSAAGTLAGYVDHAKQGRLTLGGGSGKDWPAGNNADFYFNGAIDEVAVYQHTLGAHAVSQHFEAAKSADELTEHLLPQDNRKYVTLTYDDVNDRVRSLTDHEGRTWQLDTPARQDAVRTAVLRGPAGYGAWTYTFDADNGGRLVSRTHDNATAKIEYNTSGFASATVDENNHRTEFTTDERGNVLSTKRCRTAGSCNTSYATYLKPTGPLDPRADRLESTSDARSSGPADTRFRTTYSYDALGRPTDVKYPIPDGLTAAPTESTAYSSGAEDAVGGGKVPAGLLIRSTGKRNQVTSRRYTAKGDLVELVDPAGLTQRYTYDLLGRQKTVSQVNSGGATLGTSTYEYTPRGLVSKITSPTIVNAVTGVSHTLVTTHKYDANGNTTETTYADTTPGETARTTKFAYDASDRLVRTEYADQGVETRSYTDNGLTESVTDVRGTRWTTRFNEFSKPLTRIADGPGVNPENPDATSLTLESRSYDPAGRLAFVTDAMGRLTKYGYYDDDLPATTQVANVVVDQRSYDPAGNLVEQVAAGGAKTTSAHDPAGNLVTTTFDPTGLKRSVSASYDADGNALTVERRGAADPNRVEKTAYTYDLSNRQTRVDTYVDATTVLSTSATYDERGLLVESNDRRGLKSTFEYDQSGALYRTTSPGTDAWVAGVRTAGFKRTETMGYNVFGEVTHSRDAAGNVTTTERDVLGRATAGVLPDYTPPGGTTIKGAATRTEYDRAGNPVKTTDPLQRVLQRTYDPYGRVLTVTLPQVGDSPSVVTMHYDKVGELVSQTRPGGVESRYTYDDLGRQVTSTQVDRSSGRTAFFTTTTGYDEASNPLTVTSPLNHVTSSTFNAAREVTSTKDATNRETRFGYDIAGRQASVTDPAGITAATTYDLAGRPVRAATVVGGQEKRASSTVFDPAGNVVQTTSAQGRVVTYGYDELSRVVQQIEKVDANHSITTSTGYDKLGNRSRFVDGNSHATTFTYTPWGMPESVIDPLGATFTTSYDAAGQAVATSKPGGVTTANTFDAQGRLTLQTGSGAEATYNRTFGYDPAGRLSSAGGPNGDSTYRYDDRGNLLETHGAGGEASFTYDADGMMIGRVDVTGTATFAYDAAGRLATVQDPLTGRTADYGYDLGGRLSSVADRVVAAKTSRVITYDELGRTAKDRVVQSIDVGVPPRTLIGTDYGYDLDNKITSKNGNTYSYDGAGRLASWTSGTTTTAYGWDDAGNRTSVGDKTFVYDERNRLTSGDGATYGYSARGTLQTTTRGGTTTTTKHDAFDRMTAMGGVSYTYDSLDRVSDRNGTKFQYAGQSNEVVTDGSRSISRLPDGSAFSDKGAGVARMLYTDQHGDVTGRYLSNTVDGTRTFDPFGTVTASSGDTSSVGYQGDWTDAESGAVNMSARWYQPGTGGFVSRDDVTVDPSPSAAANRYSYGAGDPIANSDPDGHDWINNVCDLGMKRTGKATGKVAKKVVKIGGVVTTVLDQMICNAPSVAGECRSTIYDSMHRVCPGKEWMVPYYWKGGNEEPLRVGDCRTFVHGCTTSAPKSPGKPTTGPGGRGKGHKVVPPRAKPKPPPPPPWVDLIGRPLPRPPQGVGLVPAPPTVDPTGPLTRIFDLTGKFLENATQVTGVLVGIAHEIISTIQDFSDLLPDPGDAKGEVDQFQDESEDCFESTGDTAENDEMETINYKGEYPGKAWGWPAQRATGGTACVSSTVPSKTRKDPQPPVGLDPTRHHKGHLIGHQFHGTHERKNIVPIDAEVNTPDMRGVEMEIAKQINTFHARMYYRVVAHYDGDNPAVPTSIEIHARGSNGFRCDAEILNPRPKGGYPNGKPNGQPKC
ncbi:LamG-like jellyroll fold domain-containing protein [Lentzea aerocolonigenes]|uniref:LamG-like jellyroll fold domain-containing protein n=1 Tax=Lentzea aerocolonigenes TaxID=68170 RepID=UPI0004C47559|nr:LamG-like jellyroll fold domain-containing protein [Lentzea aerocolonigenes]